MTQEELLEVATSLADELEAAVRLSTTRQEHIRVTAAAMKARRLATSLSPAPAAPPAA